MHIVIIGGGVAGLFSAYHLLEKPGVEVTLVEADGALASHASGMNAAQLSYTYVNPLAAPAVLHALPGILLGANSGLRVQHWDVDFLAWGFSFLGQCSKKRFLANRQALLELAFESRERFAAILKATNIRFRPHNVGKIQLYHTQAGVEDGRFLMQELAPSGIKLDLFTPAQMEGRLPHFNLSAIRLKGALYSPIDEMAGCHNFCEDLYNWLIANRPGFSARFNSRVTYFQKSGGKITAARLEKGGALKADAFLLCAGAYTNRALRGITRLPIQPVKGYTLEFDAPTALPCSVTDHAQKVAFVPFGNKTLVSGMFHFAGLNAHLSQDAVAHVESCAYKRLPELRKANFTARTGFRPCTPDSRPILGKIGAENLYGNLGHGGYGWTLAAACAARIAQMILKN